VRPDAILHPASAEDLIPSLALLSAVLLTAFSCYSYVLAIGGDKPYDVAWTTGSNSSKWFGIIRFVVDLLLAGLYVHLLLAAVSIELVGVIRYGWLYQHFAYLDWKTRVIEKAKFDLLLVDKLSALSHPKADLSLLHAWRLTPDGNRRKGAVLILDVRDSSVADPLAALRFTDEESITTEIIELRKLEL
jgi:hypothetical protein